jgi:hypothetical protein
MLKALRLPVDYGPQKADEKSGYPITVLSSQQWFCCRRDSQFFQQLAPQRLTVGLAILNFAARKLPQPRMTFPGRALAEQVASVLLDYGGNDTLHARFQIPSAN